MKLKKSEIRLLLLLLSVLIIAVTYMVGWKPLTEKKAVLSTKVQTLKAEYEELRIASLQKKKLEKNIKENSMVLDEINKTLLTDITQEQILYMIYELKKDVDIEVANIKLGQKVYAGEEGALRGFTVDTGFSFEGTYDRVKNLIRWIQSYDFYMVIDSLDMNNDSTSDMVNGQISLTLYGMEDGNLEPPDLSLPLENEGKDNLFKPFELYQRDMVTTYKENTSKEVIPESDFFIRLESTFADYPATTVGKSDDRTAETYIHMDNDNLIPVTMTITQQGKRYYYRYTAGDEKYPANTGGKQFYPNSTITFKVYSQKRVSDDDKNGIDLTIVNKSDIELRTYIINEDIRKPRVNVQQTKGKVKVK